MKFIFMPKAILAFPRHDPKVNIWCSARAKTVIWSFFLKDKFGQVVTVTQEQHFCDITKFCRRPVKAYWFQRPPRHTNCITIDFYAFVP